MKTWTRRIAATAGAVGLATWIAGVPNLPALAAASHSDGMATNPYSPAYGHSYRHGAVPTRAGDQQMKSWNASHGGNAGTTSSKLLSYGGGAGSSGYGVTDSTVGPPKVYIVFWGTQWGPETTLTNGDLSFNNDSAGAAPYLQELFKHLGTGGELWSGTMTQYCDGSVAYGVTVCPSTGASFVGYPTGGALAGVWYDNSAAEPSAASAHQIGVEAANAASHFHNTTQQSNRNVQYDIVSAKGLNPDNYFNKYCAWHDYTGDPYLDGGGAATSGDDIAFTNMPYLLDMGASCGENFVNSGSAGTLDGFSIVNGHEYAETVTDQNPAGGWTNHSSGTYAGEENGDECAWLTPGTAGGAANVVMGNAEYAMQSTWSNDTNNCAISHPIVTGGGTTTNDFSITDGSGSGTVTAGSPATTTVSTAVTSGSSQTVTLSASGLPAGATASFNPTSVSSGGPTSSSTLTISTSTSTPGGNYTITITGTGSSATHTTTYSLTVNSGNTGGGNVIQNGGFESSQPYFAGWSTSGAATAIATQPVHTGSFSALEGYYSPTGVSNISQTFTANQGDSSLTFWYYTVCGGSPTSNYATVTLKDSGGTATLLPKTCATTSGWRQVTVAISPSHTYTLTLTNSDSRTRTTYAAFDDVSTS